MTSLRRYSALGRMITLAGMAFVTISVRSRVPELAPYRGGSGRRIEQQLNRFDEK
jgi:hypothetical protein